MENDLEVNPHQIAIMFLSNFINASHEELGEMDITIALSGLITQVVNEAVEVCNKDTRVLH